MGDEEGFGFDDFSVEMGDYEIKKVQKFNRMWKIGPGGSICVVPAVEKGIFYFGSCNHNFYAVKCDSGELLWKFKTRDIIIYSSPVLYKGKAYTGSLDQNVYCLDSITGRLIWKYQTQGRVASSPCAYNNRIYVGSEDQFVYCLDAETGTIIWKFKTSDEITSSPSAHAGRVFIGSYDKNVYCLDAENGTLLWKFATQGEIANINPITIHEGKIYFASFDNHLYTLDENTGSMLWKFNTGFYGNSANPVIHKDHIYHVSRDGILFKLTMDAQLVWKFVRKEVFSMPEIAGEKIYLGCGDHYLYCLNLDGRVEWKYGTQGGIWFKAVATGNSVIFPCWDCNVYCLDIATHRLVWKFQLGGSPSFLPPPYEIFEMGMKIPSADFEGEERKAYRLEELKEDTQGSRFYKSRITYQVSTQYREKGKYQTDSDGF